MFGKKIETLSILNFIYTVKYFVKILRAIWNNIENYMYNLQNNGKGKEKMNNFIESIESKTGEKTK